MSTIGQLTPYGVPRRIHTTTLRRSGSFTIQLGILKLTWYKSICSPLSNAEDQALISVLVLNNRDSKRISFL